jgi:hypothetical protein
MLKALSTLILTLVLGTALAVELPGSATLFFTTENGTVVAVGELEEGDLSLELLAGFSGFVTITSVDEEGNVVSFEATVDVNGTVTVLDMESFEFVDLAHAVTAAGGDVDVEFEDSIDTEGDSGLERAWEVANENGHKGLETADEDDRDEANEADEDRHDRDEADEADEDHDDRDDDDRADEDTADDYTDDRY